MVSKQKLLAHMAIVALRRNRELHLRTALSAVRERLETVYTGRPRPRRLQSRKRPLRAGTERWFSVLANVLVNLLLPPPRQGSAGGRGQVFQALELAAPLVEFRRSLKP